MNNHEIVERFVELFNKNADDLDKFDTLKRQYGIASRTIHDLKGTNSLLRENYAALLEKYHSLRAQLAEYEAQPNPINFSRLPRVFDHPNQEPLAKGLVLKSTKPYYRNDTVFQIKFTIKSNSGNANLRENPKWWSLDKDGNPDSYGDFDYWLENYGPFVAVFND